MGITIAEVATAAVPAYLAIKYRIRWFDNKPPGVKDIAAATTAALTSWGLWIAPGTCGGKLQWGGIEQLILFGAAAVPLLAGGTIRARGGPAATAACVAATMVTQLGIDNACSITAVATGGVVAAATLISAIAAAIKRHPL